MLSDEELSLTKIVESIEISSTIQKFRKNMKIWLSKWAQEYWELRLLDLSAVSIFLRLNWFLRADYFTYFERRNCSSESAEFNAFKIIEKSQDLI